MNHPNERTEDQEAEPGIEKTDLEKNQTGADTKDNSDGKDESVDTEKTPVAEKPAEEDDEDDEEKE